MILNKDMFNTAPIDFYNWEAETDIIDNLHDDILDTYTFSGSKYFDIKEVHRDEEFNSYGEEAWTKVYKDVELLLHVNDLYITLMVFIGGDVNEFGEILDGNIEIYLYEGLLNLEGYGE